MFRNHIVQLIIFTTLMVVNSIPAAQNFNYIPCNKAEQTMSCCKGASSEATNSEQIHAQCLCFEKATVPEAQSDVPIVITESLNISHLIPQFITVLPRIIIHGETKEISPYLIKRTTPLYITTQHLLV